MQAPPEVGLSDRLLDAAATLLAQHGIRRTSMEDIARHARCARPTIYRHYPTRDALLGALLLRETGRFLEDLEEMQERSTAARVLEDSFVFTIHHMREHPIARGLLTLEPEAILPLLSGTSGGAMAVIVDAVAAIVARQMDNRIIRRTDPKIVAEAFVRFVASFVFLPHIALDPSDEKVMRKLFRETFLRGLRA